MILPTDPPRLPGFFEQGWAIHHYGFSDRDCKPRYASVHIGISYFQLRACSRALRRGLDPDVAPQVWRAMQPLLQWPLRQESPLALAILDRAYDFTGMDVKSFNNRPLFDACANGRLSVAKWVTARFGFTAVDARAGDNEALRFACGGGHYETARWLVETFKLTLDDIRTYDNCILYGACVHGNLDMVRWLVSFGLTVDDIRSSNNRAFGAACGGGHRDLAYWLVSACGLTKADITADGCHAFTSATFHGHIGVARWLYKYGTVGVSPIYDNAALHALGARRLWLFPQDPSEPRRGPRRRPFPRRPAYREFR